MNNVLLYLAGLVIVALAALFAVPYAIDWNSYRGVFEEEASRVLGREVRVGGKVALRLLPAPYVSIEKLRVAHDGTESGRPFFRAESFTLWLSVPPLLKGVVEAREVELTAPEFELALDANGRGNWSSIEIAPGSLPFLPGQVAFQSVRLTGGKLGLWGPGGTELVRLEGIDGVFSADDLDGPFRFKGGVSWQGSKRDVRISTAKRDNNGSLRFKTVVTVAGSGNTYSYDGSLSDGDRGLTFGGDMVAKIGTRSLVLFGTEAPAGNGDGRAPEAAASPGASPPSTPALPTADGSIEVRSKISGTGKGVDLEDVVISVDRGGIPQLISGRAGASWSDRTKLEVTLASKWIDIDRLTSSAEAPDPAAPPPLERARALFDRLVDVLPETADTDVNLDIEQVGLGGDVVSGLAFYATRTGGVLKLEDVRAGLPGGTQVLLNGELTNGGGSRAFSGAMTLGGQSLMRFASWGFGETPFAKSRSDGPFSLEGQLVLSDAAVEITDASAELNGMPLTGSLSLGLGAERRVAVSLEGHRIDLRELWPGNPGLAGLRGLVFAGVVAGEAAPENTGKDDVTHAPRDVSVDIKAGELIDGDKRLSNAHVEVSVSGGRLSIPRLAFTSDTGLVVDLAGGATGVPGAPIGALRGVIDAPTAEAVRTLARLMETPAEASALVERAASLAPWRAGSTFSFGERTASAVDVVLDGTIEGERMVVDLRFDGARTRWHEAPADVSVSIATRDVDRMLERIAGIRSAPHGEGEAIMPGTLFLKAAGTPSEGLVAVAELDAERLSLDFNGRLSAPGLTKLSAKGEVKVAADDARGVLALTGVRLPEGAAGARIEGTIAAALTDGVLTLASPDLSVAGTKLSGVVTLTPAASGPIGLEADLVADKADFPSLLRTLAGKVERTAQAATGRPVLVERFKRQAAGTDAAAPLPVTATTIWPDAPFDFAVLDAVTGRVKASLRSLSLEPGVALKDARFDLALGDGKVKVERLEGAMLGGKAIAGFTLEKLAAGAKVDGKIDIAVSSTGSAESHGGDELVGDVAALSLSFAGKALTPDALIGALAGTGELKLGDVSLKGVSPSSVSEVSGRALDGKVASSGPELAAELKAALASQELKIGQISVPVTIEDGGLKLSRVSIETPGGRAAFDTVLDLRSLTVDSEWQIEGIAAARATPSVAEVAAVAAAPDVTAAVPAPVAVERKILPPVSVVFNGRIKDLDVIEPRIVADDLERELLVRRMERDVDELERLRRLDELKARQEAARQKELERQREIERQKALEAERLLLEQQVVPSGVEGEITGAPTAPANGSIASPAAATTAGTAVIPGEAEAQPGKKPAPVRPRRPKPPPAANTWKPFQITPYE